MKKLHRAYQSFRALYRAKFLKQKTPLIITWYLTDHSHADKPCYQFPQKQEKELTSSEAVDLIDQLVKAGVQRVILTGGDPLFRFDFGGIIDQFAEKNISVFVETHGFFVEQKIEILRSIDKVILSLDGPEAVHDELRYQGSYQEVMRSAQLLKDNKISFMFKCTLTSKNIDLISVPLEIASHFDVTVSFEPVPTIIPGTKSGHPLIFSADRMRQAMIQLQRLKRSQYPNIHNSEETLNHMYHYPDSSLVHCASGWFSVHIDVNGDVYNCMYTHSAPVPNFLKGGFLPAFNRLPLISCTDCWQAYRFNLHGYSNLSLGNIFNLLQ